MENIINPYRSLVAKMTPTEFETYCLEALNGYAEKEGLKDFLVTHNKRIEASDGIYQIDVYAEFIALGVKYKTIVECKKYTYPIEREKVAVLNSKVNSLGAQKGILISTSGFQSGAVEYAKNHGIALLQMFDKCVMHIQNSSRKGIDSLQTKLQAALIERMPPYYVLEWAYDLDLPYRRIYPTDAMKTKLMEEIKKMFSHR